MTEIRANGITLEYEAFGPSDGAPRAAFAAGAACRGRPRASCGC